MPGAHLFDGVDDTIVYDYGSTHSLTDILTLVAWVNYLSPTDGTAEEYLGFYGQSGGGDGIELRKTSSNNMTCGTRVGGGVFTNGTVQSVGTTFGWYRVICEWTGTSIGTRKVYINSLANVLSSGLSTSNAQGLRRLALGQHQSRSSDGLSTGDLYGNVQLAHVGLLKGAVLTDTQKTNFLENNYSPPALGTEAGQTWMAMPLKLMRFASPEMLPAGCIGEDSDIMVQVGADDQNVDPAVMVYPSFAVAPHMLQIRRARMPQSRARRNGI